MNTPARLYKVDDRSTFEKRIDNVKFNTALLCSIVASKFQKEEEPVRLGKVEKVSLKDKYYFHFLIGIGVGLIVFFVVFCLLFVQGTESGVVYNHLLNTGI